VIENNLLRASITLSPKIKLEISKSSREILTLL
jgi:hypothetical protein